MQHTSRFAKNAVWLLLFVWSAAVLYPIFWTLTSALKDTKQFYLKSPWSLPDLPLLWGNFAYVWDEYHLGSFFFNSIFVTAISTFTAVLLSAMTAYVIARIPFRGNQVLYFIYIASMMVPIILTLVPLFFLVNDIGLYDSRWAMILVYIVGAIPFGVFVLTAFYRTLPKELEEAAAIDGCSNYGVFFRIMLPLSKPGLIAVAIMTILTVWNEFIIGTVLVFDSSNYTLPIGIYMMNTQMQYKTEWGALFAGLVISMVPVMIIYAIFQRQITSGITAGAVK